jgi:hypothetical protein
VSNPSPAPAAVVSPDTLLANYTFELVIATFALALVTVAAIVVPMVVARREKRRARISALCELSAIVEIVKQRLESLTKAPGSIAEGAAIDLLVGRAFASDIAQVINAQSVGEVYGALGRAVDVIVACREFANTPFPQLPPSAVRFAFASGKPHNEEQEQAFKARRLREEHLSSKAKSALMFVNEAYAAVSGEFNRASGLTR